MFRGLNNRNSGIPAGHEALLAPGSTLIPSPRGQANSLIQNYAAISRLPHRPEDRIIKRSLHRISVDSEFCPFSPELVRGAIAKAGGSKARGVDGVSYPHLKHLGTKALDALMALYNWSVSGNCIPTRWKVASVIPILKPGKDPTIPSSYRPISLLCNTAKILERLVLNEISLHIHLSTTQHGFRPQHSTTTLLCSLSKLVLKGFNNWKLTTRSLIAAIDISKAFVTVPRYILIAKILQSEMPPITSRSGLQTSSRGGKPLSLGVEQNPKPGCSPMACRRVQCYPQASSTFSWQTFQPQPTPQSQ